MAPAGPEIRRGGAAIQQRGSSTNHSRFHDHSLQSELRPPIGLNCGCLAGSSAPPPHVALPLCFLCWYTLPQLHHMDTGSLSSALL